MQYIGLLDCNNFFVSCERLFRPDLAHKPVAVLSSNDGCIVARSQEVKAMGVPMGIPLFKAKQLVDMSKVTLFSSNFTLYRDLSARVMQTLAAEVGKIDVYSIDEAFFAVDEEMAADAEGIRRRLTKITGIPVSIGLSKTKTLAKVASEIGKKERGVCLLSMKEWQTIAPEFPCGEVWGLGRATTDALQQLGVRTAAQFMALERSFVRARFGVAGERIFDELHGVPVYTTDEAPDERQSVTSSRSFAKTTTCLADVQSAVAYHVAHASQKIRQRQLAATMMYVELRASRHSDFAYRQSGVEVPLPQPTNSTTDLTQRALAAVANCFDPQVPYKKAGVTLVGLVPERYIVPSLFGTTEAHITHKTIDAVVDSLQRRFGFNALHSAAILPNRDRSSAALRSASYTTAWGDIPTVKA